MAEEKAQNKPGEQPASNQEGHGRINTDSSTEKTSAQNDISEVDRQEGNMNNGESGANLTEEKSPH